MNSITMASPILRGYIFRKSDGSYYAQMSLRKLNAPEGGRIIHEDSVQIKTWPTDGNMLRGRLNVAAADNHIPTPLKYVEGIT